MKNLSLIDKFILILNSVAAIVLLLCYASPLVDPALFWPIAFFGLIFPPLLVINLLFGIYWLIKLKRQILLPIITIGLGWNHVTSLIQLNSSENSNEGIKVMSYNVRLFDLYNWTKNKETRNKMFDLIDEQSADILCFQEFYYTNGKNFKFNTLDTLKQFQKAQYDHTQYTNIKDSHHFGISTLTRYPIISKGSVSLEDAKNNICIYTDLLINQDTVRVYNMHLASVHFGADDYQFIENINNEETDKQIDGSKKIVSLLKNAFIRRSKQAKKIADHIDNSPYQVIVCGDFNDTPTSYAYRTLSNNLNDGFKTAGSGLGFTYSGSLPIRIDYILSSEELQITDFRTLKKELSDHYPVVATINLGE